MLELRLQAGLITAATLLVANMVFAGIAVEPAPILCKPAPLLLRDMAIAPAPAADSRGFDVLSYDLDLRLEPASSRITGRMAMRYQATAGLTTVQLDLVPELTVAEIHDTRGALAFDHTEEILTIDLPSALPTGTIDSLTVSWSGRPPRHGSFAAGLMFRHHDAGTPGDTADDVPTVANVSETWSAHSWWPCKDHPSDKALVKLAVTVPDSLSAVSNGTLLGITVPEPGWRRYAWQENYPLPTYLVSVAVSNYESWSEDCLPTEGSAVRLDYHLFPQDRANAAFDLGRSCEMMSFLTELLGPWPYPGEKYAQVEFKWIGGMEHTTATSLAQLLFTGDRRFETLFLHEMVHQWFGDSLTPAVWADVWLNEGFARYGEALWIEHTTGPQAYDEFMARIGPERHPELFRGDGLLGDPDPILPNALIYDKGAWVLHMLRGLLGDDVFFTFLRDYATDPALTYGSVTTADMITVAERAAGTSLNGFFNPWLNTDLVPVVSHNFQQLDDHTVAVTLTQHQTPVFQLPVTMVLHGSCGNTTVMARFTQVEQRFQWAVDCTIDSVTVAPPGTALLRSVDSPPPPLQVVGPAPNPSSAAGTDFMLFLEINSEVVVNTYAATGRLASSANLGHLTANGPSQLPEAPGHPWHWVPQDSDSRPLPAGLYYLEFKSATGRQVQKVTLLH